MKPAILVETHSHTRLCKHALGEPNDYAAAAHRRGWGGLIVTCHNPMPDGFSRQVRMEWDEFPEYLRLVFQARQFAMGVQGQVYVGALASAYVVLSPVGQTFAAIPLGILAAMLAGAVWGFIPGIAKAKLGANEIVSSLMLNYIAI